MTTRESRREEYNVSSNVVRSLNPSRPLSPYTTQKSEFDNSLDYILDDLQQSVSRPGSSLGQPITNYSTHREVQYLNPINTTSISRERSMSPNTSSNKVYKTSKYEYSTSNNGGYQSGNNYGTNDSGNFSEINKLDTLLSDLEHERTATLDRNKRSVVSNNIGIDSGLLEPGTRVVKTTTTYTSKNPVQRELHYESPDSSGWRSTRHNSPGYDQRTIESTTSKRNISYDDNGLYGGINKSAPRRTMSPVPANTEHYITETSRTMTPTPGVKTEKYITETRTINNEIVPIPKNVNYNEVVRVENSTGPSALQDMQLSDDILPKPKTKVTTTVRTYTYEIPEPDQQNNNSTIVYNQTNVSPYPDNDPPKNTAMFYKTERNQRSVNYYPNQSPPPTHDYPNQSPQPILAIQEREPPQNSTTIYKYDVTNTRNTNSSPSLPPGGITLYPQQPNHTTIYKTETTNTTNKQYRSPTPNNYYPDGPNGYPNGPGGPGYPQNNGYSPANGYPPHQPQHQHPSHQHPNEPSVIVYKTTTTNTTRNMTGPRPAEREPLLQPFPVDGPIITDVSDGNPPKRVEDLMASFGDTSEVHYTNKRVQIAEKPLTPTRMQNTQNLVPIQRGPDDNEDRTKTLTTSRNIAGPPVYYPPNHEMFSAKEEAAYRAQGGYARGSGKYMYESESKSKSSSKSGAAVVPVCLPLCCAMPCTIM